MLAAVSLSVMFVNESYEAFDCCPSIELEVSNLSCLQDYAAKERSREPHLSSEQRGRVKVYTYPHQPPTLH